jgi:hypothetical protein
MFELNHTAEIRALNIAKGKDDDAPVCATISLDFVQVGPEPIMAALGCTNDDLKAAFTENGECHFHGIHEVTSWATFEDKHVISMLGFSAPVAKINKIAIRPTGFMQFSLSCNVQVQDASTAIETIARNLHGNHHVKLDAAPELPLPETH